MNSSRGGSPSSQHSNLSSMAPSPSNAALYGLLLVASLATISLSSSQSVEGSVTCLDCNPHKDLSGTRVAVKCRNKMEAIIEKKGSAAFAGFGVPPASDEAAEKEEDGRRRKPAKSFSWSRFWGKTKTAPLPVDVATHGADVPEKIQPAKMSAGKKGLRQIFCKSPSRRTEKRQDNGSAGTTTELHLKPHPSTEGFRAKPAPPPPRVTEKTNPGKGGIKRNSAGSSTHSATFGRDGSRKGERRGANVEAMLAMLAVMLMAMLLGGRVVAILCTAACFYMSPSLKTTILSGGRTRKGRRFLTS